MHRMTRGTGWLTAILATAFYCHPVTANPTGPRVVHGQANFSQPDVNTLNITNTPGAIINWQQFSIGQDEITRFIQESSSSAVLNRVVGQDPSSILGQLLSNGKVYLINPNGMVFGEHAVIDTAGFVASTLDMTDEDFINEQLKFQGDANAGAIRNMGYIKAGADGDIYLIAPNIENNGVIETQGGNLILAAGQSVTIASLDDDHIVFDVQAPEDSVVNLGQILTHGGAAQIFAGTIQHSGTINADSVSLDEQGRVQLVARADIEVTSDAVITANGPQGGSIEIKSETGTVSVSGTVEARGLTYPFTGETNQTAQSTLSVATDEATSSSSTGETEETIPSPSTGETEETIPSPLTGETEETIPSPSTGEGEGGGEQPGKGGTIHILGAQVALMDAATVDASGDTGGGEVLIGGDFQGSNPDIKNAQQTYVGADTEIKADAINEGDGGKVIVWADDTTIFDGNISATGGENSGNGGFAEVSGKEHLQITGHADLTAPNGNFGTLLLDPGSVSIQDGAGANSGPNSFDDAYIIAQLGSGNLTIATSAATGGGNETITIAGNTDITWSQATTLQLDAGRNIVMNSGAIISNTSATTGFDAIIFNANQGTPATGTFAGIDLNNATLSTVGGDISLTGLGGDTFGSNYGIYLHAGTQVTSTDGSIIFNGTGGDGTVSNHGVNIDGAGTLVNSDSGLINITGVGGSDGTTGNNSGIILNNGAQITSTTSNILLSGTGPDGVSSNRGVDLIGSTTLITSVDGLISITGVGGAGSGGSNYGIFMNSAKVQATGTGSITLNGSGGSPVSTTNNLGIFLSGAFLETVNGQISITGTSDGSSFNNNGVLINTPTQITSSGAGTITIAGTSNSITAADGIYTQGVSPNTVISSGSGDIVLISTGGNNNHITLFNVDIQTSGDLIFKPANVADTIDIGVVATGADYVFSSTYINQIEAAATVGNIVFGRPDGSGNINIGTSGFDESVKFLSGSGDIIVSGVITNTTGASLTFNTGATITLGDDITTPSAGTLIELGTVSLGISPGSVTLNGDLEVGPDAVLEIKNGDTLSSTGDITLNGTFNWSGGVISGTGLLITTGTSTLSTTNSKILSGRTWNNTGTVDLTDGDLILSGSIFNNQVGGIFNISTTNSVVQPIGNGIGTFNNAGIFNQDSSVSNKSISSNVTFNNSGTVNVNATRLAIMGDGTDTGQYDVDSGTILQISGTRILDTGSNVTGLGSVIILGGILTVNGDFDIAATGLTTTVLSGGIANFNVPLTFDVLFLNNGTLGGSGDIVINGNTTFTIATLSGTGDLTTNGTVTISVSTTLNGKTWTNNGVVNFSNDAVLNLDSSAVFNNQSLVTINPSGFLSGDSITSIDSGTFNNTGSFSYSSAINQTLTVSENVTFSNTGSIFIGSDDTLQINNFASGTNAGLIRLNGGFSGAVLSTNGDALINTGTISGTGTVDVGGAILTNNGTITPGLSPGKLTINGDLTLTGTSILDVELGGTNQGVDYDWLDITGSATLDGTLNATLFGGFSPTSGNSFQIITAANGITGSFATTNLPANISAQINANDVILAYLCPGTICFDNSSGDFLWTDPLNWDTDTLPTSTDDVVIDLGGGITVVLSSGTQSIGSITIPDGNGLEISGGTLDIAGTSTIDGTFNLTGGTLTGAGNITINGAFNWADGTVSGSGLLTTTGISTLTTTNPKTLSGSRTWDNAGTVNLVDGALHFDSSLNVFTNLAAGIFNISATNTSTTPILQNTGGTFNNAGTLNKDAGGTQSISTTFNNQTGGVVNVNAGTLTIANGGTDTGEYAVDAGTTLRFSTGTRNLDAGSNITGAGNVVYSGGTVNVNGSYDISGTGVTSITGGTANFNVPLTFANTLTLSGTGTLDGSGDIVADGTFNWSGGTILGTGLFTTNGASNLSGNTSLALIGRQWDNGGDVTLSNSSTSLFLVTGAEFNNLTGSTFTFDATVANTFPLNSTNSGTFNNAGVVNSNMTGPAVRTISPNVTFNNTGTLNVNSGTLSIGTFDSGTNSGTIAIASGATLLSGSGSLINDGTVTGNGTVDVGTGNTLTNNGIIGPGASPGTLTINGNYVQGSSGVLTVELGGLVQGVSYDLLQVTGTVSLDGTLDVLLFGAFTGSAGDLFDIITSGSTLSGDFSTVNVPLGYSFANTPFTGFYELEILDVTATTGTSTTVTSASTNQVLVLQQNQDNLLNTYTAPPEAPSGNQILMLTDANGNLLYGYYDADGNAVIVGTDPDATGPNGEPLALIPADENNQPLTEAQVANGEVVYVEEEQQQAPLICN